MEHFSYILWNTLLEIVAYRLKPKFLSPPHFMPSLLQTHNHLSHNYVMSLLFYFNIVDRFLQHKVSFLPCSLSLHFQSSVYPLSLISDIPLKPFQILKCESTLFLYCHNTFLIFLLYIYISRFYLIVELTLELFDSPS